MAMVTEERTSRQCEVSIEPISDLCPRPRDHPELLPPPQTSCHKLSDRLVKFVTEFFIVKPKVSGLYITYSR